MTKALYKISSSGKDVVRERIRGYQAQCDSIARAMTAVALRFRQTFRSPCPIYLTVQKLTTGAVYLRWRRSGAKGKQPYMLMEGNLGKALLGSLPSAVRQSYLRFHQEVISLNYQHALLLSEQRRLEFYLQQLQALEQLKVQFGVNVPTN